jgi:hypothetical protein
MKRTGFSRLSYRVAYSLAVVVPITGATAVIAAPLSRTNSQTPALGQRPLVELSGADSKVAKRSYEIVSNQEDWNRLWQRHTGRPGKYVFGDEGQPAVNFDRCVVVAVFQGTQASSLGVFVREIVEQTDRLVLRFDNRWFASGAGRRLAPARPSMPFGFFVLPRISKEIVLEEAVYTKKDLPPIFESRGALHVSKP